MWHGAPASVLRLESYADAEGIEFVWSGSVRERRLKDADINGLFVGWRLCTAHRDETGRQGSGNTNCRRRIHGHRVSAIVEAVRTLLIRAAIIAAGGSAALFDSWDNFDNCDIGRSPSLP